MVPVKAGDRVKTDRRDALKLARSYRAGDLTPVCVGGTTMSRIDPRNVVVLVRDSNDVVVRIGVSNWLELREIVRIGEDGDERRLREIETQVGKAMSSGIASS